MGDRALDEGEIPDKNLFMMCETLNVHALRPLPNGYHIRYCRKDELALWKAMPFDDQQTAKAYDGYMTDFFERVYAGKGELFYETCKFVCNQNDEPIATAFVWKSYDEFNSVHWLKVLNSHENKGIGRALLSVIMQALQADDYPVYLHTQPGSYRAIKLYADFGFKLLSDPMIGSRHNDLVECLPILERYMLKADFVRLQVTHAPADFLQRLAILNGDQF
ncbi:MAG: GNAT family N-acetyltransferase [Anaerolineae bacterium]|nr:GNAT family N-acetyltransferase [Anaerolineae bacterium]